MEKINKPETGHGRTKTPEEMLRGDTTVKPGAGMEVPEGRDEYCGDPYPMDNGKTYDQDYVGDERSDVSESSVEEAREGY